MRETVCVQQILRVFVRVCACACACACVCVCVCVCNRYCKAISQGNNYSRNQPKIGRNVAGKCLSLCVRVHQESNKQLTSAVAAALGIGCFGIMFYLDSKT